MAESELITKLQIIQDSAYKITKHQITELYKDRAESDVEFNDCKFDMQQHIRFLEFRRQGCEIKLDNIQIQSNALVEEVGNIKDVNNSEISKTSSEDRAYMKNLWTIKFETYNQRVKAIRLIGPQPSAPHPPQWHQDRCIMRALLITGWDRLNCQWHTAHCAQIYRGQYA